MNRSTMDSFRELDALAGALREGTLSEADAKRLSGLLETEPEARRRLVRHFFLATHLMNLGRRQSIGVFSRKPERTSSRHFEPVTKVWMGIAAVLMLCLGVGLWMRLRPGGFPWRSPGVREYATLVDQAGAVFAEGPGDDGMLDGDTVDLTDGVARLVTRTDVEILGRAPLRFRFLAPNHISLGVGSMRVIVPDEVSGFTVSVPGGEFEDLGTEFGVTVRAGENGGVLSVFDGRVAVRTAHERRVVQEGQSLRVRDGVSEPADPADAPDISDFPAPQRVGYLRWQRWRRVLKTDPDVVLYYPFYPESADASVIRDESAGPDAINGRIVGAQWVTGRWPEKSALLFDRDSEAILLNVPGSFERLTLAAWVKLDRLEDGQQALFHASVRHGTGLLWKIDRNGRSWTALGGRERERRFTSVRVPVGVWVHLASVTDTVAGAQVTYVNGEPASTARVGDGPLLAPGACVLGTWLYRSDSLFQKIGFRGRMDAWIVWKRALSREEIAELVRTGEPVADRPSVAWKDK